MKLFFNYSTGYLMRLLRGSKTYEKSLFGPQFRIYCWVALAFSFFHWMVAEKEKEKFSLLIVIIMLALIAIDRVIP